MEVWGIHITFIRKIWCGDSQILLGFFLGRVDIIGISGDLAWGSAFHVAIQSRSKWWDNLHISNASLVMNSLSLCDMLVIC